MVRVISCIWTISWQENWPSPVLFKFSFVTNIFFQVLLELLCRTGMGLWSLDPDVCLLRWTFSSSEQTTIINVHWHGFWGTASEGTGAHSWLLKKQKEPWAWWVGESWQTSLFLWVTFFCYYRNRELPSSSHLWDTHAFFSQESPVKARSNTVFTVFLCRSERPTFLWDSWVLSALILLWLGRFTCIASHFRYGSFKMVVSSVFGYQVFRSI